MSKWIEVEPLMDKAKEYGGYYEDTVYAVPLADISEAPSIDIVQCGECKYNSICNRGVQHTTRDMSSVTIGYKHVDFCSYGVKKGADDE